MSDWILVVAASAASAIAKRKKERKNTFSMHFVHLIFQINLELLDSTKLFLKLTFDHKIVVKIVGEICSTQETDFN